MAALLPSNQLGRKGLYHLQGSIINIITYHLTGNRQQASF